MSNEPNAAPDQRSVTDQIIMAVDILSAAELHDVAAWIVKNATAIADRKIAEVSEPLCGLCGEELTARGGDIHGCGGDCDAFNHGEPGGCHKFVLAASESPASEPFRTDAVKEAAALMESSRSLHPNGCPTSAGRVVLAALADAERELADATWGHCAGHMKEWRELSRLAANLNNEDDPCVGCAYLEAIRYIDVLGGAIFDGGPTGDPIAILCEQREGAERESKIAYERIAALTRKLATIRHAVVDGVLAPMRDEWSNQSIRSLAAAPMPSDMDGWAQQKKMMATALVTVADALAAIDAPAGEGAERIKCAAILNDHGNPVEGFNHAQIIAAMVESAVASTPVRGKQGFVTTSGRFVGREEAARIALASGQIPRLRYSETALFSEDINYPDAPPPEPACAWLVCGKPESTSCHRLCGRRMDESRQGEFCGDAGCHRFVPPEPANAQGSEAARCRVGADFDETHACNKSLPCPDHPQLPSAQRFTAEEARERARAEAMMAARCERDVADDPRNEVLHVAANEHHRKAESWRHYADLLELERAAGQVIAAWLEPLILTTRLTALVRPVENLRVLLAERARKVE